MLPTHEYSSVLSKVQLFADLIKVDGAFEKLLSIMEKKSFQKGQEITTQGQSGEDFFVLVKGQLSVRKKTIEGEEYNVALLDSQMYPSFGEGGLIDGEVRNATIICETNADCLVLNKIKFNELCNQSPNIGLPIFKKISFSLIKRLNQTTNDLMMLHKALMDEIRSQ